MNSAATFARPTLEEALSAWKQILAQRGFSHNLLWIFEENLCFEKPRAAQGGLHLGFQDKFTPPPGDALDVAYDHFCESDSRIVFYRLGESRARSLCILLCDSWFNARGEDEGFVRRNEWGISFFPGAGEEIEEISDLGRWVHRIKRRRGLHALDFCMTLATIDEIKIYGRPLAPYERFAQIMLNRLRRFLGQPV